MNLSRFLIKSNKIAPQLFYLHLRLIIKKHPVFPGGGCCILNANWNKEFKFVCIYLKCSQWISGIQNVQHYKTFMLELIFLNKSVSEEPHKREKLSPTAFCIFKLSRTNRENFKWFVGTVNSLSSRIVSRSNKLNKL